MADSPSPHHKSTAERGASGGRRPTDLGSSPMSYEESEGRSTYPTLQLPLQERKIFGFEIYVDNDVLGELGSLEQWFSRMAAAHQVEHIRFNSDLTIPDLNGRNIQVFDVEMEKKYQCAKAMLADIYQAFKRTKKEAFSIIIFVPQGMVSLLIGAKGHQINKIMKESHTTIVVNQPINRMTYRTAKIQGYHSDIAKACRIIYQMLEQKSSIAYSIEKQPSQLDYTKSKIKSKFIFTDALVSYLQKRKKRLLGRVQQQTKCSVKFQSQKQNRLLKKQQYVCILNGKLQDVQAMVVMVINLSHQFLSQQKRNIDYTLKMLIPANYVTKLIGQKGYMIRDIIQRSGGAQIKILSDKQEKDRECIISINGSKENKIDAACFILEQIQCFKNGGPILQSGKSINQNLAQQFKNSLPLRDNQGEKEVVNQPNQQTTVEEVVKKQVEGSEQQGLIEGEEDEKNEGQQDREEKQRLQREKRLAIERDLQRLNPIKKQREHSKRSRSRSESNSRSRSRDKDKKKSKKMQFSKKARSESESGDYKHDRQQLEIKVVVPKKLGQDHRELKYIESLCKCTLTIHDLKLQSGEVMVTIRGSMKDNSRCIQLLQKRLLRFKPTGSSAR